MNNAKSRLQALGLLDRAFKATPDAEIQSDIDALGEEHREALDEIIRGDASPEQVRTAISSGRMDGTMESAALVLTDACLADCIEALGDHADHPSSEQLREVLPALVKKYGKGTVQIMLAATVAGEAPAAAVIRDLLKNDDLVKLPPAEVKAAAPPPVSRKDDAEREALRAKRKEQKAKKQEAARLAREQSKRDRGR